MGSQVNLLTVDMEEWFVAEIFSNRFSMEDWPDLPSTVVRNTRTLLNLFKQKNVRATWFVLGWVAEKHPGLIRDIVDQGHELGCHSYRHKRVDTMTPEAFREDLLRATEAITNASGVRPLGFRAPSWSINNSVKWAFEILAETGYEYDSSIFPIKHDIYGMPLGPTSLFRMSFDNNSFLWEIPASTYRLFGRNIPVSGGGYFRHSPYWYMRTMIRRVNRQGRPAVIYVHPWEVDPNPPEVDNLAATQRFRAKGATKILMLKMDKLLSDFEFTTCEDFIAQTRKKPIGFR